LIALHERQQKIRPVERELDFDFDESDPSSILEWAVEAVGRDRLVVATSFGPSGMVNLHMLADIAPEVPVVFVDTLYHFEETLELANVVSEKYGLDVRIHRPAESRAEFERMYGPRLRERDLERFHLLTKVQPMERALEGVSGWITGRRRDQAATRAEIRHVEIGDRIKVNPLASWTRKDVWTYILDNEVPYNPLHDRGYASIGDAPLTTPVSAEEDERAGRWRGQDRVECGLHTLI
jgi:phosphoadenosine phosphosulfate reductase